MDFYQLKEEQCLRAIESGDVRMIAQLLSSGISINTVLLSRTRCPGATILGTAAFEGRVEIVSYLIRCGVPVNYQDPLLRRSALHWAAIGSNVTCIRILIENDANINCCDRDNVTPIIFASMSGDLDSVVHFINCGAIVNSCDRLHSSALHYATFYGKSNIIRALIKAGCIVNDNVIFGKGTPLANLIFHEDFCNIALLIEAGYDLSNDVTWLLRDPNIVHDDTVLSRYLLHACRNPETLQRQCRRVVRKLMNGCRVSEKISHLPVPSQLKDYLSLAAS